MGDTSNKEAAPADVATALRRLISSHFKIDIPARSTSLLDLGLSFDSVSLVQLIVLVEEHFRISFDEDELRMDAFSDLDSLATLIGNKIARR